MWKTTIPQAFAGSAGGRRPRSATGFVFDPDLPLEHRDAVPESLDLRPAAGRGRRVELVDGVLEVAEVP